MAVSGQFLLLMAIIKKIKLPNEATARDIGANSSNIIYDGDAGATTTLNEKIQSIFTAIGDINSFEIAIVNELPATGDDHTIYFVPESAGSTSHNEYMYIDNHWELIGSTTIDLSDYVTETELTTALTPYVQTSALTTTLDDRYVNVAGDIMTGLLTASTHGIKITNVSDQYRNITVKAYAGYVDNYDDANPRLLLDDDGGTGNVVISGVATPKDNTDAANKYYVDNKIAGISIPTITPVAALTTGVTIGSIDINGTTTTFYAPAAPTPTTYTMSMTGPTINLLADGVAASTITLSIWDGTLD